MRRNGPLRLGLIKLHRALRSSLTQTLTSCRASRKVEPKPEAKLIDYKTLKPGDRFSRSERDGENRRRYRAMPRLQRALLLRGGQRDSVRLRRKCVPLNHHQNSGDHAADEWADAVGGIDRTKYGYSSFYLPAKVPETLSVNQNQIRSIRRAPWK